MQTGNIEKCIFFVFFALLLKKGIFCLIQQINRIGVLTPIYVLCQQNQFITIRFLMFLQNIDKN